MILKLEFNGVGKAHTYILALKSHKRDKEERDE